MIEYIIVDKEEEFIAAAKLFEEYAAWLKVDLSFQRFDEELQNLKIMYASPLGGIILCKQNSEYIGCIAVRPQEENIAELKRMYIKPGYRKKGIGNELLKQSLHLATKAGYKKIRLDTLNTMTPAMNLYKANGFYTIPAYYYNPEQTAVYFEKEL